MTKVLVLLFFLHHVTAFQYNPGCVCRNELKLPTISERDDINDGAIPWSVAQVGVWVPCGLETTVMELRLSFTDYPDTEMNDVMQVYRDHITVSGRRPERVMFPHTINSSINIIQGWADLQVKVDKNLSVWLWNSTHYEVLIIKPMPAPVRSIDIRGSNLTLECHTTAKKLWWIDENTQDIPLFPSARTYEIQMYSPEKLDPYLILGNDSIHLSWEDDTGVSQGGTESLPQNTYHNITLHCYRYGEDTVVCVLMSDRDFELMISSLESFPDYLTIGKGNLSSFFVSVLYNGSVELTALESTSAMSISAVVITAVTVLLLLLILGTLISLARHLNRSRRKLDEDMTNREESIPLVPLFNINIPQINRAVSNFNLNILKRQSSRRSIQDIQEPDENPEELITAEDQSLLWKAVVCGKDFEIKHILQKSTVDPCVTPEGRELSPVILAHLSGNVKNVEALESNTTNDLILEVLKVYEDTIDKIFNLACEGHFRHEGGVEAMLKHYSLPGSIRDKEGRSLLHVAVTTKTTDGEPLWDPEDICGLVRSHGCFPNTIDHKGRTCLMALVENLVSLKREISQDSLIEETHNTDETESLIKETNNTDETESLIKETHNTDETEVSTKSEAWTNLAGLLVDDLGCDPNISDYRGVLPKDIAKDKEQEEIEQIFTKENNSLEYKERKVLFEELLIASEAGDCTKTQQLLLTGSPITMIGEDRDPLMLAIAHSKRDTALLLLSIGSPIIDVCLSSGMIERLPAIYGGLARREIRDRLQSELSEASTEINDKAHIKEYIEVLMEQIIANGSFTISLKAYDNERDIFITSASLGFSTFCHILGLQTNLNFLPDENHPIRQCQKYKHQNTFKILCWHLKLNPLCITRDHRNISQELKDEFFEKEMSELNNKCKSEYKFQAKEILEYINNLYHSRVLEEPSGSVLVCLAECGLVSILNRLVNATLMELDAVIHTASGATMLHVAAACGTITMVTYLLYHGVSPHTTMNGNLTAAHIAGFLGYKDCLEYIIEASPKGIQAYHNFNCKWESLDPIQAHLCYSKNIQKLCLLSANDTSKLMKIKDNRIVSKNVLELKLNSNMEISNEESLLNYLKKDDKFISKIHSVKMMEDIENDLREFCDLISIEDPIFKGKLVSGINFAEKSFLMLLNSLDFFLELEISYDKLKKLDGNISLEIIGKEKIIHKNILSTFITAAEITLNKIQWKSIILIPSHSKVNIPNQTGINIHCIWHYNNESFLLCLNVNPVLKVLQPKIEINGLPKDMKYLIHQNRHIYLQNTASGLWNYNLFPLESYLIHILPRHDQNSLILCNLLVKLISPCWWLPRNESDNIQHSLVGFPSVFQDLPSHSEIFSCLLEVLACDDVDDESDIIERSILILSKFTNNEIESKTNFLLPKYLCIQNNLAVEGIVQFLSVMQNRSQFSLYGQSFRI